MPRKPRKSQKEWDAQKERIHSLYIAGNQTLKQTMKEMKEVHNFDATQKEYLKRLEMWQMSKNLKRGDWKLIHDRNLAQKSTLVHFNDRQIDPKRLKRAPGRYKFGSKDYFPRSLPVSSIDRGLTIRSPSPSPIRDHFDFKVDISTVPWFQFQDRFNTDFFTKLLSGTATPNWEIPSKLPVIGFQPDDPSLRGSKSLFTGLLKIQDSPDAICSTSRMVQCLQEILPQRCMADIPLDFNTPQHLFLHSLIYLSSNNSLSFRDFDRFLTWIVEGGGKPFLHQIIGLLRDVHSPTMKIFLNGLFVSSISLEQEDLALLLLESQIDPHGGNSQVCPSPRRMGYCLERFYVKSTINPLQLAVIRGNYTICEALLSHGANPNAQSCDMPFTPLELAISLHRGNFPIAELLVKYQADPNHSCDWQIVGSGIDSEYDSLRFLVKRTRRSLLMKAVETQNIDTVRLLIRRGASVNFESETTGTAIQTAVRRNDLNMVELLLEEGADINTARDRGSFVGFCTYYLELFETTCQNISNIKDSGSFYTQRGCFHAARFYFDHQTDWWVFCSPIQIAVQQNNIDMVRYLFDASAGIADPPNWSRVKGQIPLPISPEGRELHGHMIRTFESRFQYILHDSLKSGNIELTEMLLRHGALSNQCNGSSQTPLQLVCGLDDIALDHATARLSADQIRHSLVQTLLDGGSDINAPAGPNNGRTALQASVERGDTALARLLLDNGADINSPPSIEDGLTVLQAAAKANSPSLIMNLAKSDAELTSDICFMALYSAALEGEIPIIDFWVNRHGSIASLQPSYSFLENNGTILQAGIKSGDINVVTTLLNAGAEINSVFRGETALCTATRINRCDIFKMLFAHGASLNVPEMCVTPLAVSSWNGFHEMTKTILDSGADVNQLSHNPEEFQPGGDPPVAATPLFWALRGLYELQSSLFPILGDRVEAAERISLEKIGWLLLSNGADPNRVPPGEISPLHVACSLLSFSFTKELIEFGAQLDTLHNYRDTVLVKAVENERSDIVQLLLDNNACLEGALEASLSLDQVTGKKNISVREDISRSLIRSGARLKNEGELLGWTICAGYFNLARDLIQDGSDVDYSFPNPSLGLMTPLEAAAEKKSLSLVQLLLDHDASPNSRNVDSNIAGTALQLAVKHGDFNMARLLIERGANINAPAPSQTAQWTALQHAACVGHLDIAHLLLHNDREPEIIAIRREEASKLAEENGHAALARILDEEKSQMLLTVGAFE